MFEVKTFGYSFKLERKLNPIDTVLDFIVNTYPVDNYPRVLEIAAGTGNLSSKLADFGYHVTAMDPRINFRDNTNYTILKESFSDNTDISDYDLGIAIHPCGIHKDIISNFRINEKAFFLIPCHMATCDDRELTYYEDESDWLNYLESLNPKMKRKIFFDDNDCRFDSLLSSYSNAFYTTK